MNLQEIKDELNYIIDNNVLLESKGLKPYTACLEGGHGIGKTAIIEEIAKERQMKFTKINLGAFEEVGDLTGFPVKKYEMEKDGTIITVAEALLDAHLKAGYNLRVGQDPVMDFAIPKWVPRDIDGPNILLLDDYSRANPLLLQATMELLDKGELGSWKLPKNTQVILTSNPDNGEYSVNAMDRAQRTRFITFNVDFNVQLLAKHMEEVEVRSEFINFALVYPEIFDVNKNQTHATGRTYMAFARTLESVKDLSTMDSLSRVHNIASGIFNDQEGYIATQFTAFINRKLDKLITPEDLINKDWKIVAAELDKLVKHVEASDYRADIASTLTTRLVNYTLHNLKKPNTKVDPFINRILDIVRHDKQYLSVDLIYSMASRLFAENPGRVSKLLTEKKFKDLLLS